MDESNIVATLTANSTNTTKSVELTDSANSTSDNKKGIILIKKGSFMTIESFNKKMIKLFLVINCVFIHKIETTGCSPEGDLSFKNQNYFIKKDYISREVYFSDDERNSKDECQDEVYAAAFNMAKVEQCKIIADIGCGSGFKLLKYFKEFKTIGFDIEPNFSYLNSTYPEKTWHFSNFTVCEELPKIDIIICADAIEYLLDPDQLLNWIRKLKFRYLVISTPDRELLPSIQGSNQCLTGPPKNPHHVREWNFAEFRKYISQYFDIIDHFHTKKEWWGQTIIASKKQYVLNQKIWQLFQ